jgi:TFIIF-interacting CTD phosphatase-like protein
MKKTRLKKKIKRSLLRNRNVDDSVNNGNGNGNGNSSKKINVVLDLDNTLIYSYEHSLYKKLKGKGTKWLETFPKYEMDNDYVVCERPYLQKFLTWLFKNFNVMVWSAASPDYVDFIVKNVILSRKNRKLDRVFNSTHCDESQSKYNGDTKNLNLLWDTYDFEHYGPYNTLIIDDMKHVIDSQPHNAIRIKKFVADEKRQNDSVLKDIKKKLTETMKRFDGTPHKSIDYKLVF